MVKKKACKKCKLFVAGDVCPGCGSSNFSTNWHGILYVNDPAKSMIAEKVGAKVKGEYAIKVR